MSLDFMTENWGLKILALILAIVLYHAVKQSSVNGGSPTPTIHDRPISQKD